MGGGVVGVKQTFIVGFCAFGEADQAVAFSHLEADAGSLCFVAFAFLISFLIIPTFPRGQILLKGIVIQMTNPF